MRPTEGDPTVTPVVKTPSQPASMATQNAKQRSLNSYLSQEFPLLVDPSKSAENSSGATHLVEWLKRNNIKVIAADFDLTMLTVHSGGWIDLQTDSETYRTVLGSLSSPFISLAKAATSQGLHIGVVTFADSRSIPTKLKATAMGGSDLVRAVLCEAGNPFVIDSMYALYPKNYQDAPSYRALGLTTPMPHTKSYHLKQLRQKYHCEASHIVLIDDSIKNCIEAVNEGYVSIHVAGECGFDYKVLRGVVVI